MKLSLVIACYNEAEHLEKSFVRLIKSLNKHHLDFEIIFVEDGSGDETLAVLKKILTNYPNLPRKLIIHNRNMGRGRSVADGMKKATGEFVGYIDIDLEISPNYISSAIGGLKTADVILGNRSYGFSLFAIHRYLASKGYAFLIKKILNLPVHDTESGFKFFRRKKILPILKKVRDPGWFWDTEIIVESVRNGLIVSEIPVIYARRLDKQSTVHTLTDSLRYLISLNRFLNKK